MIKNERNKELEKKYKIAREILVDNVPDQYVFPKYFVKVIDKNPILKVLYKTDSLEKIGSLKVNEILDFYNNGIKDMEFKSDCIANWENLDNFPFFQFVMTKDGLLDLMDNIPVKEMEKVNNDVNQKILSNDDALKNLSISKNYINEYIEENLKTMAMENSFDED